MNTALRNALVVFFILVMTAPPAVAQSSAAERQRQEQQRRADEQRRQNEMRQRQQQQEQQRRADEQRKQNEMRQRQQQQEQQRRAEEQRRQNEARQQQQEQQRRAEEQSRQNETKQQQEQQRRADAQKQAGDQRRAEAERQRASVKSAPGPQLGTVRGPTNAPAPRANQKQPTATNKPYGGDQTNTNSSQNSTGRGAPPLRGDQGFERREGNNIKINPKPLDKTTLADPSRAPNQSSLTTGGGTALSVPAGALIGSQLTGADANSKTTGNNSASSTSASTKGGQATKPAGRPAVNCIRLQAKPSKDPKYAGQTMQNTCGERIHIIWCHSQSTHPGTKSSECGDKGRYYQQETVLEPGKIKDNFYTLPGDATIYWGACFGGYGTTKETGTGKFDCVK